MDRVAQMLHVADQPGTLGAEVLARLRPRASHRAEEGRTLGRDEIVALLSCRGPEQFRLLTIASGVRDRAPCTPRGRGVVPRTGHAP